jgi:hypothetical protein
MQMTIEVADAASATSLADRLTEDSGSPAAER